MKITLEQVELEKAIKAYVEQQGFNLAGKTAEITFNNGRASTTVDIDIQEKENTNATTLVHVPESSSGSSKSIQDFTASIKESDETPKNIETHFLQSEETKVASSNSSSNSLFGGR